MRPPAITLTHNGETLNLLGWEAKTGVTQQTIRKRMKAGLSSAECLAPVVKPKTKNDTEVGLNEAPFDALPAVVQAMYQKFMASRNGGVKGTRYGTWLREHHPIFFDALFEKGMI